tara:strand:- start:7619 stop:7852 length:234 start_codon:yes stop_codon:yes gene_type:complete
MLTKNKHNEIATSQTEMLFPPNTAPIASPNNPQKYGVCIYLIKFMYFEEYTQLVTFAISEQNVSFENQGGYLHGYRI